MNGEIDVNKVQQMMNDISDIQDLKKWIEEDVSFISIKYKNDNPDYFAILDCLEVQEPVVAAVMKALDAMIDRLKDKIVQEVRQVPPPDKSAAQKLIDEAKAKEGRVTMAGEV